MRVVALLPSFTETRIQDTFTEVVLRHLAERPRPIDKKAVLIDVAAELAAEWAVAKWLVERKGTLTDG